MIEWYIKVHPLSYERVLSELDALGERTTPIIFREETTGSAVVIQHGDWGKPSHYENLNELRDYIEKHSNVSHNETIHLVSCYCSSLPKDELKSNNFKLILPTSYPIVTIPIDSFSEREKAHILDEHAILIKTPENDEEAVEIVKVYMKKYINEIPERLRTPQNIEKLFNALKEEFLLKNTMKNAE